MSEIIRVLKFVRDRGPVEESVVCDEFNPFRRNNEQSGSQAFLAESRTSGHLRALQAVGLVEFYRGADGHRILCRTTALIGALQSTLGISLADLISLESRHPDAVRSLRDATVELDRVLPPSGYRASLIATMRELTGCIDRGFYTAAVVLSGKVLEICLKEKLLHAGVSFDDSWMLGTLLGRIKDLPGEYMEPSMSNVANIIKECRNPAVHAREQICDPSAEQALVVTNAVLDILRKKLLAYGSTALPSRPGRW